MKYIPCKKKKEEPKRKINRTPTWVVRDPDCNGNIKVMCNNCYCYFSINNSDELEKYDYCPRCGVPLDKSFAIKQLNTPEIKERILINKLRNTIDNWPQWKKDYAEMFNQSKKYEPLDFP